MQARVSAGYLGYVFLNSRFTVGEGVTNSTLIYQFEPDNLTFLNCTFADVYGPNFVGENKPLTPAVPTVATAANFTTARLNRVRIFINLFRQRCAIQCCNLVRNNTINTSVHVKPS